MACERPRLSGVFIWAKRRHPQPAAGWKNWGSTSPTFKNLATLGIANHLQMNQLRKIDLRSVPACHLQHFVMVLEATAK